MLWSTQLRLAQVSPEYYKSTTSRALQPYIMWENFENDVGWKSASNKKERNRRKNIRKIQWSHAVDDQRHVESRERVSYSRGSHVNREARSTRLPAENITAVFITVSYGEMADSDHLHSLLPTIRRLLLTTPTAARLPAE